MNYQLIFHPEAEEEYLDAYLWYEEKQEGLGDRFEQKVEQRLKQISEHPEHYAKKKASFRESSVDVFPFRIVFVVNKKKKSIYVAAIYHTKRAPKHKYRKIK